METKGDRPHLLTISCTTDQELKNLLKNVMPIVDSQTGKLIIQPAASTVTTLPDPDQCFLY
jgi:hypothetical protein